MGDNPDLISVVVRMERGGEGYCVDVDRDEIREHQSRYRVFAWCYYFIHYLK